MPLLIITGIPASGKSFVASELQEYFSSKKNKRVWIIPEACHTNKEKNYIYNDSQQEKIHRGNIKAAATRLINSEDLVIIDDLNYIKGFRYELYCISKQHKTAHCIVQCLTPIEIAWKWNENRAESEKYSKYIFDALIMRYEPPDSRNRWDSPMMTIIPAEGEVPFQKIFEALYERKPPPPNQSTQLQPLTSNNFLHELDKCTQDIISTILDRQKLETEGELKIPNSTESILLTRKLTLSELSRIRRQFITYTKSHPVTDSVLIKSIFVQYLNKSINLN